MITAARNGVAGALVIRGDPGIGKSALLQAATTRVGGVHLVRLDGYEAEAALPFAGLQRVLVPLTPFLAALPDRHRRALLVAVGEVDGPPPDRFLVGLSLLGLLARAGESSPVVLVVDDAHWLDPESLDVLAFAARRVRAEAVAVLMSMRDDARSDVRVAGIDELQVGGLDLVSGVELLRASLPQPIDPLIATQIATSTGGNPLALIDLARDLSVQDLTGSGLADEPIPVGRHLEEHYVRRTRETDPAVQSWLLVAAADSTGDLELIGSAARLLGLPDGAADDAEAAGLVELGRAVMFRHPLVRAAVYNAAAGARRRRVHAALSQAAELSGSVELEAWHAAKATLGIDGEVADRLERVADQAGRRGGMTSRANVLARAAELTPPGALRNGRLVSAAEAALAAGAAHVAAALLETVDDPTPYQRGRILSLRAALTVFTGDPDELPWGCARMLEAAQAFHGSDPQMEQAALIRAFELTLPSERLIRGVTLAELGRRLGQGAEVREGTDATVLRALSALVLLPYERAVPLLRAAVDVLSRPSVAATELLRLGPVSVALTTALWDRSARAGLLSAVADLAREAGALQQLETALWTMSLAELTGGTPRRAGEYVDEVRELRRAMGYDAEQVVNGAYLAWAGAPRRQIEAMAAATGAAGWGGVQSSTLAALAVRELAEGRYRDAYERLRLLVQDPFLHVSPLQYPDFVEAAVRSGHGEEAEPYVQVLESMANANGSPWMAGVAVRSRALVAPDGDAEADYEEAVEQLTLAGTEVELARAHLLYGEWLRRLRRRRDARHHLRTAMKAFQQSGATMFADRARAELEATGERTATGSPTSALGLTSQEATVARLAASGHTNAEIGATLFISVNTVDYHLRKVFQKLGVSSRRQLVERLDAAD